MIAIVDTSIDNLDEIKRAVRVMDEVIVTADKEKLSQSRLIILYSTSSFPKAMCALHQKDLIHFLKVEAFRHKPFLGIGTGMHLLFTSSDEEGFYKGLNLLPGRCLELTDAQEGWSEVTFKHPHPLYKGLEEASAYFSHSFYVKTTNKEDVLAIRNKEIPVVVGRRNLYGVQFLPEKSGEWGQKFLQQFVHVNCSKL